MNLAICSLASGSSGNCYLVASEDAFVLVDAGISAKQIKERTAALGLDPGRLSAVLVTHGHSDHVKGIASLVKCTGAAVYANEATACSALAAVPRERIRLFETGDAFLLEDIGVRTFSVSHDAEDPAGFSFLKGGRQVSIVTDTGVVTPEVMSHMKGADILVLESNHDADMLRMGRYPWFLKQRIAGDRGHLSNEAAGKALAQMLQEERDLDAQRRRTVLLAHLSRENNFPEMAMATVQNILEERRLLGPGISIRILSRDRSSPVYSV